MHVIITVLIDEFSAYRFKRCFQDRPYNIYIYTEKLQVPINFFTAISSLDDI